MAEESDNNPTSICRHVQYFGRVQGVGFRYTAQHVAGKFPVAGYVRNLPDGSVELVAEGEATEVEAFLQTLARGLEGYIERTEIRDGVAAGHTGFRIRH